MFGGKFFSISNIPSYGISEPQGDIEEEQCNKECITRSKFRAWLELLQCMEEDLAACELATKQEAQGRREMKQSRKQREKRGRRSKWKERR